MKSVYAEGVVRHGGMHGLGRIPFTTAKLDSNQLTWAYLMVRGWPTWLDSGVETKLEDGQKVQTKGIVKLLCCWIDDSPFRRFRPSRRPHRQSLRGLVWGSATSAEGGQANFRTGAIPSLKLDAPNAQYEAVFCRGPCPPKKENHLSQHSCGVTKSIGGYWYIMIYWYCIYIYIIYNPVTPQAAQARAWLLVGRPFWSEPWAGRFRQLQLPTHQDERSLACEATSGQWLVRPGPLWTLHWIRRHKLFLFKQTNYTV